MRCSTALAAVAGLMDVLCASTAGRSSCSTAAGVEPGPPIWPTVIFSGTAEGYPYGVVLRHTVWAGSLANLMLPMARRLLPHADGRLAGAVVGVAHPSYFSEFCLVTDLGEHSGVTSSDGRHRQVARFPTMKTMGTEHCGFCWRSRPKRSGRLLGTSVPKDGALYAFRRGIYPGSQRGAVNPVDPGGRLAPQPRCWEALVALMARRRLGGPVAPANCADASRWRPARQAEHFAHHSGQPAFHGQLLGQRPAQPLCQQNQQRPVGRVRPRAARTHGPEVLGEKRLRHCPAYVEQGFAGPSAAFERTPTDAEGQVRHTHHLPYP